MVNKKDVHPFTQRIIRDIIWKISLNEYRSGAKLPSIESIAKNYEVARSTVRESIKYMETTGLVYSIHGKGTFIADFVPSSNGTVFLEHIIDLRRMIEGFGVIKAAENRSDSDIVELEELLTQMEKLFMYPNRYIETDRHFHFTISKAAKNPFIPSMLNNILSMFAGVQDALIDIPDYPYEKVSQEHARIVEAIKNKDSRAAEKIMQEHLNTSQEIWIVKNSLPPKQ